MLESSAKAVLLLISVLLSTAFATLVERKSLSSLQIRKGPNKVGVGFLQPFSDALKLFSKEVFSPSKSQFMVFMLSPILILFISLLMWVAFPCAWGSLNVYLSVLFILSCIAISVYPILGAGWASNSKFPLLGSLRAAAQSISYEVSLAIIFLCIIFLNCSFSFLPFLWSGGPYLILISLPLGGAWVVSALAETNRTPFDLAEGESELVSGFNTEFSSGGFALFFLAEYNNLLFMSLLFCLFYLSFLPLITIMGVSLSVMFYFLVWVRGTLPRLRYDKLMNLAWKFLLPVSLSYLTLIFSISFF